MDFYKKELEFSKVGILIKKTFYKFIQYHGEVSQGNQSVEMT